jgi:hypothetical protein
MPLAGSTLPTPAGTLLQVIAWLPVLVTMAVNCCVCPAHIVTAAGHTLTPMVFSGPTEAKVEAELSFANSVAIQSALRSMLETRTSEISPFKLKLPGAPGIVPTASMP